MSSKISLEKARRADPPLDLRRASWDEYFMNIAKVVASRSTCDRKFVGAVIVRDKTILSTGYNGSIRKFEHCSEVGHMMENNHCVATIHAEANAILQAAKNGVCIDGATIYTSASPCWPCFKMIANAGIKRICYGEFYRDERIFKIAKKIKLELVKLETSHSRVIASAEGAKQSVPQRLLRRPAASSQ
jgi:dCMP deaminase